MKKMQTIKIEKRMDTNKNANMRLRKTGVLPASICGKGMETMSISVKSDELRRVLTTLGRNSVFNLEIPNETPVTVVIKEIQHQPVTREYLHVEFQHVSLSVEIHADVPIRIVGVDALDAKKLLLMRQTDILTVKGFPQDIPESIELDVSNLEFGDSISIGDVKLPEGIVIENNLDLVVLSVTEAKVPDLEETVEETVETEENKEA